MLSIPEVSEYFLTGCLSNLTHPNVGSFAILSQTLPVYSLLEQFRVVLFPFKTNVFFKISNLERFTSLEILISSRTQFPYL